MASIPTQQTFQQLLGGMLDPFLGRQGLSFLKIADPLMSAFEAIAQSQLRNQDDTFTLLRAINLDASRGAALDRLGLDEDTPRLAEQPATGYVTVTETAFKRISSKIFQGTAPPIVGSSTINVEDASLFPPTGQIYLGRGTTNVEGPISYTSVVNPPTSGGSYYKLILSSNTLRFHNVSETVTLAQGGDRAVSGLVQTPQGSASTAIQYSIFYPAVLPDGETVLENLLVVATKPGLSGNIPAGAINAFVVNSTLTVTNPAPYITGQAVEKNDAYRARIRLRRLSKSLGTIVAITTYATGVTSNDESKRSSSASFVSKEGEPSVLYVDDGTGYQEQSAGTAIEPLVDSATGGERYFKVSNRPIAKASLSASILAPYNLEANSRLAFSVGGVITETSFNATQFKAISSGSAYEVASAINSDANLLWQAKVTNNGRSFFVFAQSETNEDIQLEPASSNDAAPNFGFSSKRAYSLALFRDDEILTKDGLDATIFSLDFSLWGTLAGPQTLVMTVDGIQLNFDGTQFASFADADFVNAKTGFTSLGKNSLQAWAQVLNYRVPGITTIVSGSKLSISSNRGKSTTASVGIVSGTLVTKQVVAVGSSVGQNSDYTLNRNTGELKLATALATTQSLSIGSTYTAGFLESLSISNTTLSADATMWFCVDGQASVIQTGIGSTSVLTLSKITESWGDRQAITLTGAFGQVQEDDFLIAYDTALAIAGVYRIREATTNSITVDVAAGATGTVTLTQGGLVVVRSGSVPQAVVFPRLTSGTPNTYTANSVVGLLNGLSSGLDGATAIVYRTTKVRVATNNLSGDIALVAKTSSAFPLGLSVGSSVSTQPQLAAIFSSPKYTPAFTNYATTTHAVNPIATYLAPSFPNQDLGSLGYPEYLVTSLWATHDTQTIRPANNRAYTSPIDHVDTSGPYTWNARNTAPQQWLPGERFAFIAPYQFAFDDVLNLLADNDIDSKRFAVPLFRSLTSTTNTYGLTNTFTDTLNGGQTLAAAFGYGPTATDFSDFAVHMAARAIINTSVANSSILWRYNRLGPDGNGLEVTYGLPSGPSASPSFSVTNDPSYACLISMLYGSGALKTGYTLPVGYKAGYYQNTASGSMADTLYILSFKVISFTRTSGVATVQLQYPIPQIKNAGLAGAQYNFVTGSAVPSGTWDFTSVTVSENDPGGNPGLFDKFVFNNAGIDVATVTGNVGYLYFGVGQTASFADGGSPALQNDYFRANTGAGFSFFYSDLTGSIVNVPAATNGSFVQIKLPGVVSSNTVRYTNILDPNQVQVFSPANATATALVAAWNALPNVPIQGKNLDAGSGILTKSLSEYSLPTYTAVGLSDGLNWIRSQTSPSISTGNYSFTFKAAISGSLATGADWANEVVRLVPTTRKNMVTWLNSLGVSGLSSVAKIASVGEGVQISSLTAGSEGSIWVQSGLGNSATASAVASPFAQGTFVVAPVAADDAGGFRGSSWVDVQNTQTLPKAVFSSSTEIGSISPSGNITFINPPVYTLLDSVSSCQAMFERQGEYMAVTDTGLGGALSLSSTPLGSWVRIVSTHSSTGVPNVSTFNQGIFQLMAKQVNGETVMYFKGAAMVEQQICRCSIFTYTYDSIMPGDLLSINTPFWGIANTGSRKVVSVGNNFTDPTQVTVDVTSVPTVNLSSSPGIIGSNYPLIQIIEAQPYSAIKFLFGVFPNSNPAFVSLYLGDNTQASKMGPSAGTVYTAKNKAAFDIDPVQGADGYRYNTGLLQEVNRVIYGDLDNPTTYPGVAAAGASINIEGPLVKRITASFLIRTRLGFNSAVIGSKVKSAVASVINASDVGESIAISSLIAAAQKVVGVESIVVLSPMFGTGSDLIPVQPYEKAAVFDVESDIGVTFSSA